VTIEEVKELKADELRGELDRLRRHVFDLRAQSVTEKLKNPFELTKAKKAIARILTVLRQRDLKVE
jgi:large subunit ribosomal protein L29